MAWVTKFFSSSIGKKLIMALTGLFLCSFLVVHAIGNAQLFYADKGLAFNRYATFMTSNPLIEIISIGLYAFILIHSYSGLRLAYLNRKARPVQYNQFKNSSTWQARNMAVLGTVILIFLAVHMTNFWYKYRFGVVPYKEYTENVLSGEMVSDRQLPASEAIKRRIAEYYNESKKEKTTVLRDLYREVEATFSVVDNPFAIAFVLLYVLAQAALAYHLVHGFQSSFQTLGLNHPKYNPLTQWLGIGLFGIVIPAAFAAMPIYFYLKSLGV